MDKAYRYKKNKPKLYKRAMKLILPIGSICFIAIILDQFLGINFYLTDIVFYGLSIKWWGFILSVVAYGIVESNFKNPDSTMCTYCEGTGRILIEKVGEAPYREHCPKCGGSGELGKGRK